MKRLRPSFTILPYPSFFRSNASSLSGGRILKCFPHPIARSAAHTVAGPTLKKERAEVRGFVHRVARRNWAFCSQRIVRRASLVVRDTLRRPAYLPHHALLSPWGTHHLYLGAES